MRTPPLTLLLVAALACARPAPAPASQAAADAPGPVNLDFERGAPGQMPEGWRKSGLRSDTYRIETRTDSTRGGSRCLVIARASLESGDFATAMQRFDARPWRGRRVEFAAWLRYQGDAGVGSGALWVRVNGPNRRVLAFHNMSDRPVSSPRWTAVRIVLDVPAEAETLNVGVMLGGSGTLWADDARFRSVGTLGEGDIPPRALSARGLDNLVAFTRLLGYVRHFDPADSAAATDWDAFAIAAVDAVEGARGPGELVGILRRLFQPLDPALRVDTRPVGIGSASLRPRGTRPTGILAWQHHGWGSGSASGGPYWSRRDVLGLDRADLRPGRSRTVAESLGGGAWCAVPMSLWADGSSSLPRAALSRWRPVARPPAFAASGHDRATRLAGVVLCWNVIQHFYPYFDVVKADWNAALREALSAAATDHGDADFLVTLERLMAHLDDGHAGVSGPGESYPFVAPISWHWVEGRLVVTAVDDSVETGLHRGDVVLRLDGQPTERRYEAVAARISAASEGWRRSQSLGQMAGEQRDTLRLEVQGADGAVRTVAVAGSSRYLPWGVGRPEKIAQLRPGIWYVDATRVDNAAFATALDTLARARGVIFDVRGYPRDLGLAPLGHLADTSMTCAQWHIPIVSEPDHRHLAFDFSNWKVAAQAPRFRGRIAFLIDARAISYAETWLGIVEHYRLGALVGEPTAGTNGDVNTIALPGGYTVRFTGMKVLKHDGSRHHGVGIRPTVPVSPTIAGIRAGRDEQLEKAIEAVGG